MEPTGQLREISSSHRLVPAILVVLVVSVLLPGPAAAAADETSDSPAKIPTIAEAQALIGQQDWAGASALLEQITRTQPENARAWAMLGFARLSNGEFEPAEKALVRAASFPASAPRAMINLGRVNAATGDLDAAFEWLGRAKETRQVDMTQVLALPELAEHTGDKRFKALLPSRKEFARPFVEKTRIIHEWHGETPNEQYGWIARNIGDVDEDGIDDVTTSAPTKTVDGKTAGEIYAYSGKSGKLLWSQTGSDAEQLGLGIEAAGDTNGDGVPDVLAGAPGSGRAYVYSGRDGKLLITIDGEQEGEQFGQMVSNPGDWNGDGHADLLVGAPLNDERGADAGRAAVYSGKDGSRLLNLFGERAGDNFGSAGAGAVDKKRKTLVVGAPNAGENNRGRTYVYSDSTGKPGFVIEADETGGQLGGMFVSVVGDVDADGALDVYASDFANSAKGASTGRIFVHSGKSGERLLTLTGETAGDGFGIGPADAGDVDGDGHDDLIVGAWQQASGAPSGGKTYLYSGKTGELLRAYTCRVDGETFGFDATGMGDVNGDGSIDFLLTSAWSAINGYRSGRMFIVSGELPD